jgi:hypothetical protein
MEDIPQKEMKIFPAEEGIFFFFRTDTPAMGPTQPPIKWEAGFYLETERPVREATQFIWCQVKIEQSYFRLSIRPVCLHAFYRGQFTLLLPTFNIRSAITFVAVPFICNK